MFAHLVHWLFKRIDQGRLRVVVDGDARDYGDVDSDLAGTLEVHDPSVFRDLVLHGEVGLGHAYVAKKWSSPDLESLTLVLNLNIDAFRSLVKGVSLLAGGSRAVERWVQKRLSRSKQSTLEASSEGMSVAYDVGEDFFRLMLGENMLYSCAVWASPEDDLEAAQAHKIDLLIKKMSLSPEHRVLDIGCGWGTLLKAVHTRYGCPVKGISLARKQIDHCRATFPDGIFDYLDYRQLPEGETYDRIVSVGMIEHVGHEYIRTFMDTVARLLAPGGRAVLHTMIVGDTLGIGTGSHLKSFAASTIMPISYIPTPGELLEAVNRSQGLNPVHYERFGQHYGKTMRQWRRNVLHHRETLERIYSPEHVRVYDYIWGMSSGCFVSSNFDLLQLVVEKGPVGNGNPVYDPRA